MSSLLLTTAVPIRVRYLGLRLSPPLREAIERQAERLAPNARAVESCELHVGKWQLHRDEGHVYRVSLEVELKGGGHVNSKRQSALNASPDVLPQALQEAFDESLSRLSRKA